MNHSALKPATSSEIMTETLQAELSVFQDIENTLKTQHSALLTQNLEDLEKSQQQLFDLSHRALQLEQQRCAYFQESESTVTLSDMIRHCSNPIEQEQLKTLQQNLQCCLETIQAIKQKNSLLFGLAQQRIQDTIEFWVELYRPIIPSYSNTPDDSKRSEQDEHLSISTVIHSA
jgi:FlgN protein